MRIRRISVGTLLWFTLFVPPGFAAEPGIWDCHGKFGLCRYLNAETKQEMIPARFERGMPFSEGLAAVSIGGRFGYIDERGEIVIEAKFDLAGEFVHGLAEILIGDKTGVINRKGEMVVPPMFRRAIPLTSDVIVAAEGTFDPYHSYGFGRIPGDLLSPRELENAGLYHVSGYWIRAPDLRSVTLFDRENRGLIWASARDSFHQYGLLASNGEWIIRPQFESAGVLNEDRATVGKRVDGGLASGAVDPTGQIVVPLRLWTLYQWKNGLGVAREGGKWALLDGNGNLIGGRFFDQVDAAGKGDISKVQIDGRWVGLDRAGNIVANPDNGTVVVSCPSGVRAIKVDDKVQVIDASGRPTTPYLFEPVYRATCDGPFSVTLNGLHGFVGVDGRLLFDPPAFKDQTGFEGGYAAVLDGRQWRIIDTAGQLASPVKFDKYLGRNAGLFHVTMDGRDVWLTAKGEERPAPPRYPPAPQILDCSQGLRLIEREGLWGIADADGADVIAPRYRALDCFRNGVAWAAMESQRQWCALGPDGVQREKPACRTGYYPSVHTDSHPEKFDSDPFENSVLWSRAYLDFGAGHRDSPPRWISRWIR